MRRTRLIPNLLIHRGGVYKTSKFKNPIYIGDPINAIRLFNDLEVDEIAVLDIDASKQGTTPNLEMIGELASEAFMPFAYGGGIQTTAQAHTILQCGIEKIILNHSVQNSPELIAECAAQFGSQSVVVSIDYKKRIFSGNGHFDHVSNKVLKNSVVEAAVVAERAGAGEILINSVDRDGLMVGMDVETIKAVSDQIGVPLIVSGGAGNLEHLKAAEEAGASAISAGSMLLFHGKQRGVLINYPKEAKLRQYLR